MQRPRSSRRSGVRSPRALPHRLSTVAACAVFCCLFLLLGLASGSLNGADLLSPETPPETAIDHYIDARLQRAAITPAPPTDDAGFLRRVMLDLVGRPPTAAEAQAFIAEGSSRKRIEVVDRLLASPAFIRQQAAEFDAWLMADTKGSIREYLLKAFREQRGWDRMFRDMIVGEPEDARQQGAIRFAAARAQDPDKLVSDVSVAFFGVNVTCAKCHDHPLVSDWQQEHYYGMLAFFSRTHAVGEFLAERDYGQVSYQTVAGESRSARPMFLSGVYLDEPPAPEPDDEAKKEERKKLEEWKQKKEPPPAPAYSRRAALVEMALADPRHDFFARAIVNQLCLRLLGRGLVMPADQMHSENPPSHPELLAWLARDLQANGFDLVRLIRGVVLSQAYARSSRWNAADRPDEDLFAVAQVRLLQPWQYATLLKLVATGPEHLSAAGTAEELDRKLLELENSARGLSKEIHAAGQDAQVGVTEALWLANSPEVSAKLLADQPATLVGHLARFQQPAELAEAAIWHVFARPPAEGEVETLVDYLESRADRPGDARRQLVWALMTSAECRFNY